MKKILFLSLLLTIGLRLFSQNEDIQVYHGRNKTTSFIYKNNEKKKMVRPAGDEVKIVILNPNPLFYTYEFKVDEVEIKEDVPDISSLIKILTPLFESSGSAINTTIKNKAATIAGKAAFNENEDPLGKYRNQLNKLNSEVTQVQTYIRNSDNPETRAEAVNMGTKTAGLEYEQNQVRGVSAVAGHFNSVSLLKDLDDLVDEIKGEDPLIIKAFKAYNKSIVEIITELKKRIFNVQNLVKFSVPAGAKQKKVKLIIRKTPETTDPQTRDEIEEELVIIEQEFTRKNLEIIPVANLTYASDTYNFSLKNGVVTKESTNGWKFRGGAMLIGYPLKFGTYKEWALGVGLGFNVPKDQSVLENFYLGTNISFKNIFRVGAGWGFSEYPSSLKYDVKEGGALPANINRIEDIITYDKKGSFFITFSISGIPVF